MSTTSSFDILSLPELVMDNIFSKYLDLRSLKVLRLTCREVNGLIENNPAILKRFRIVIRGVERLDEILSSKVPWNNLCIRKLRNKAEDVPDVTGVVEMFFAKLENLSQLLSKHLTMIEIANERCFVQVLKFILVNSASTLEVVQILNLRKLDIESFNSMTEIVEDFPKLEFLEVEISEGDGTKLRYFLMKSLQLRRLIIRLRFKMKAENVDKDLAQPLKDYLNYRFTQSIRHPLEINFPSSLSIPPADLIEIGRLCFEINAKLENVSISSLPTYGNVTKGQSDIKKCLDGSIRSVMSNTDGFEDQYIPSNSQISAVVDLRRKTNLIRFELPKEVHSISVTVLPDRDLADEFDSGTIDRMLHSRPFLKELKIRWDMLEITKLIRWDGVPNLTKLELCCFGTKDEDFWKIYEALPLLEVLILRDCLNRNESIIGPEVEGDNRSMLNLKHLKHLTIRGRRPITDISFTKVFSQMKLLTFKVWTDHFGTSDATCTLAGLEALRQGIFAETVELIIINRPDGAKDSEVKNILQKCKYLKNLKLRKRNERGWSFWSTISPAHYSIIHL